MKYHFEKKITAFLRLPKGKSIPEYKRDHNEMESIFLIFDCALLEFANLMQIRLESANDFGANEEETHYCSGERRNFSFSGTHAKSDALYYYYFVFHASNAIFEIGIDGGKTLFYEAPRKCIKWVY